MHFDNKILEFAMNLHDFEEIQDQECQGFCVGQEVVPKKSELQRTGTIQSFLRNKEKPDVFAASLKWEFVSSGSSGMNYQLLSTLDPKGG